MEKAVSALPFHSVHIFRPSFIMGERPESRPAERIATAFASAFGFALVGGLCKYRPIEADAVAAAMLAAAREAHKGVHIYQYKEMQLR